jgi:hypothetical protein
MIYVPSRDKECALTKSKLSRLKRNPDLNTIALRLGLHNYKSYKTKQELVAKVISMNDKPSSRCYNKSDPCSLEDMDSIQSCHLIEWNQFGKHFGANVCSLKTMFDNEQYILPWTIDFASGVCKSANVDAYMKHFDMRRVDGLVEAVDELSVTFDEGVEAHDRGSPYFFLFEMDRLMRGDDYAYGYIINNILAKDVHFIYTQLSEAMYRMYAQLSSQQHIFCDVFHQYVYLCYSMRGCHVKGKQQHLQFVLDVFQTFVDIIGGEQAAIILKVMFLDMRSSSI